MTDWSKSFKLAQYWNNWKITCDTVLGIPKYIEDKQWKLLEGCYQWSFKEATRMGQTFLKGKWEDVLRLGIQWCLSETCNSF